MTLNASTRTRLGRAAVALLLCGVAAACEPPPAPPVPGGRADLDTFVVSHRPTATRGDDPVLRIMGGDGKTKIAYLAFPVARPDTTTLSATLTVTAGQAGLDLEVSNVGSFSEATTYATRPAVGSRVGSRPRTVAGRQAIALRGVRVVGGRVRLALTTTGARELEITSSEGAAATGHPERAPSLTAGAVTPGPGPAGWRLTFADEFDGTAVDESKWNVYDQRDDEWVESPKDSTCARSDNVTVGGGKLVMRTRKANGGCTAGQAQSGAGMNTWGRFGQAGGRFEVRGRWTDRGNYLWGGFWTAALGELGNDPSEIDTWEYIGEVADPEASSFSPAIHYDYTCDGTCGAQRVAHRDLDVTAWHTYVVEWEPTDPADPTTMQVRFSLDGRPIAQFDRRGAWRVEPDGTKVLEHAGGWRNPAGAFPNPFGLDRPHQLILSAWVGAPDVAPGTVAAGYRPAAGHADLEVDYVRVYTR